MNVIKQYGLERTGTNYLKALIDLNTKDCRVLSNLFGLKHEKFEEIDYDNYHPKKDKNLNFGKYTDITEEELKKVKEKFKKEEIYYLVTFKDPYSWVISYNNCHWLPPKHGFNSGPLNINKVKSYLDRWNSVYNDWVVSLPQSRTLFINYDDLIINTESTIKDISKKFDLTLLGGFKDISNRMWPGIDVHGSKNISNVAFDKKIYYLNKEYMNELSSEIKNIIKTNVDKNTMKKMGYDI